MVMFRTPASTASSMTYWISGLSTRGSISFGWALVAGRNRVPNPAAGKTAFAMRISLTSPCHHLLNHCAHAEPTRPIEEMHRDQQIVIDPLPQRFVSGYIGIALVRPIDEQWLSDNFIPSDESPIATVVAVITIIAHHEIIVGWDNHWAIVIPHLKFFRSPRIGTVRRRIHM